jgi:hypothetical protein
MLNPPPMEYALSAEELQKLGALTLRWSTLEFIVSECLAKVLNFNAARADLLVFPMSLETKSQNLTKLNKLKPFRPFARKTLEELSPTIKAIQYVRNSAIHSFLAKGGTEFHLRSKNRILKKEQIFQAEELTNYGCWLAFCLFMNLKGGRATLPSRPPVPDFLSEFFPQTAQPTKKAKRQRRSRQPRS